MESFTINPAIVHDTIEGEVILLNLETGTYYQLKNQAVRVWDELERGAALPVAAANLALFYRCSPDEILEAIHPFIAELIAESILFSAPSGVQESAPPTLAPGDGESFEFHPPVLLKYTDMQSLLLLDPIHEVDTPGWPQRQPNNPA